MNPSFAGTRNIGRLRAGNQHRVVLWVGATVLVALIFSACGPKKTPPGPAGAGQTTAGEPAPAEPGMVAKPAEPDMVAAPAEAGPEKWACKVDGDCRNSCSQGAVNSDWYKKAAVNECEDGCENQLSEAPRCIDGGCVAFRRDPQDSSRVTRYDHCTRKR